MGAEIVLLGVGAAISAFSAIKQGQAAKEAGEFNANAAMKNAEATRQQGAEEERRLRAMTRKQIGEARANYGASNLSIEGSPLDVLQESVSNAERDAINIRSGSSRRAAAYEESASFERRAGANGELGGYISAVGTLASGASRAYSKKPVED